MLIKTITIDADGQLWTTHRRLPWPVALLAWPFVAVAGRWRCWRHSRRPPVWFAAGKWYVDPGPPKMRRVGIASVMLPRHTKKSIVPVDAETGEMLAGVRRCEITQAPDGPPLLVVEFNAFDADVRIQCPTAPRPTPS